MSFVWDTLFFFELLGRLQHLSLKIKLINVYKGVLIFALQHIGIFDPRVSLLWSLAINKN